MPKNIYAKDVSAFTYINLQTWIQLYTVLTQYSKERSISFGALPVVPVLV